MADKYEMRVTAFIDILGFKEHIKSSVDNKGNDVTDKIELIHSAYQTIRDVWDLDAPQSNNLLRVDKKSKIITTFSDSLVISFKLDGESEIFFTLLELKWMLMRLVYKGILCRGAVTYGKLYHDEKMLFGPALVDAYTFESKVALYPRIILEKSIIDLATVSGRHSPSEEKEYIENLLQKDSDGMYYIDFFMKAQSELDDPTYDFPTYIDTLSDLIRLGLNVYKMKPDVKIKYLWLKERYNDLVQVCNNKKNIEFLKKSGETELADYYSSLKKINPY